MDLVFGKKIAVLPEGLSAIVLTGSDGTGKLFSALAAFEFVDSSVAITWGLRTFLSRLPHREQVVITHQDE